MYRITAMEINILLQVLNPNNHARLLDTLPDYQTHPAQLLSSYDNVFKYAVKYPMH